MYHPTRAFTAVLSLAHFVVFITVLLVGSDVTQPIFAAAATHQPSGTPPGRQETKTRLPLTLAESVLLALQNNRDIRVERLTPLIGAEEVRREAGVFFSPRLSIEANTDRARRPSGSILAGAEVLDSQSVDVNTGVSMRSVTGGLVALDFRNRRLTSNSAFQLFDPQYTTDLSLTLTHPLLKNFGTDLNRTRIKIAQNTADMSKHQLATVVTTLITNVQHAYWELVLAHGDLAARRQALDVVRHLHQRSQELVAGGRLPAIAELQARTAVLEREIDLTASENTLQDTQQRLKGLLNLEALSVPADLSIVPTDTPQLSPARLSLEEGVKNALAKRPELFQAKLDITNKQLGVRFARNQTLPEVNVIGGIGLNGLSGTPTATPLPSITIGGVPIDAFFSNGQSVSSFEGGYDDALGKLLTGDFLSYKVGVTIQIPLRNVSARSDLTRARLEVEKGKLFLESLEQKIALEVESVARGVSYAHKVIEGTVSLRQLAERKLDLAREGLGLGVSSVTDVLEAEKNVTLAQRDELRAVIEYNKLLTLWERVTGIALERFHISL